MTSPKDERKILTVSCQGLLVPCLAVTKPVHTVTAIDRVFPLVVEVFPAGILEGLEGVQRRACMVC